MKQIFIVSKGTRTSYYGVGTYIGQLVSALETSSWCINIVELDAPLTECNLYVENHIRYFKIPCSIETAKWNIQDERYYHRSVFYWLMTHTDLNHGESVYCHFNFSDSYELAKLFKKHWKAIILFTLHYMEWKFYLSGNSNKLMDVLRKPQTDKEKEIVSSFKREKKFMSECCDRIVVVSQHSYTVLQKLYEQPVSKLFYMPHALEDKFVERSIEQKQSIREKYHITNDERILLFVGRLNIDKGIYNLIRVFKELLPAYPHLHLIIAGDGNLNPLLNLSAPYWNRITFTGYADTTMLEELYSIADVGIIPSYYEELGYVAIEMMMHRLPIICSNASGLLEVTNNGEYGMVIDWNENNRDCSLRNMLKSWIENSSKYKALAINGRERYLTTYAWENYKKQIELLYQI